jgi:hypothetical protein
MKHKDDWLFDVKNLKHWFWSRDTITFILFAIIIALLVLFPFYMKGQPLGISQKQLHGTNLITQDTAMLMGCYSIDYIIFETKKPAP